MPGRTWNRISIPDWGTFSSQQVPYRPWDPFSRLWKG